jgi:hypothetical protein
MLLQPKAAPNVTCGYGPYDLSPLMSYDLYSTDLTGYYVYAYRPCAVSPICTSTKASACQLFVNPRTPTDPTRVLSIYTTNVDCSVNDVPGCWTYTPLYASNITKTVSLGLRAVQNPNGDAIGCIKTRGVIVNYLCAPLSAPVLYQVQDQGCLYEFTIYTQAACLPTTGK